MVGQLPPRSAVLFILAFLLSSSLSPLAAAPPPNINPLVPFPIPSRKDYGAHPQKQIPSSSSNQFLLISF